MAKKRARSEVVDDRRKDNIFKKRMDSLTKQANDLSVLCGLDMGIVVHKSSEDNAVFWPSPHIFEERMQKFLDFPEMERTRKMVMHEEHIQERLNVERGKMVNSHQKNKLLESHFLMNELLTQRRTFQEVDLVQLNDLMFFADEMLKKLKIRDDDQLNNDQDL